MWIFTGNKLAKFHGNTLSLSENIAKSFRGLLFDSHCICYVRCNKMLRYRRETTLQSACYSFGQKWKTLTARQYFTDIIGLSSTTVI